MALEGLDFNALFIMDLEFCVQKKKRKIYFIIPIALDCQK